MLNLLSVTFSRALRKSGLTLVMAFVLAILLSGCQSEPVITSKESRDREYLKSFVNEFGSLPSSEKVFDVTRSTLTVISQHSNPVKVYYADENGNRVLVGDLTIPAGREEVPFILPSGIDRLIVDTSRGEYTATIGSELNLDETAPSNVSRAASDYAGPNDFRPTDMSRRIRFKPEDIMPKYWARFPEGENNLNITNQENVRNWGIFLFQRGNWMLYPVYWKNDDSQSYRNCGLWQYATVGFDWRSSDEKFDQYYYGFAGMLACFHFDDDVEDITAYDTYGYPNTAPYVPGQGYNPKKQSYSKLDKWIQFSGVCLPRQWTPTIFHNRPGFVSTTLYDEQRFTWSNYFWNVDVEHLHQAYQHIVMYKASGESITFRVPSKGCPEYKGHPAIEDGCVTDWETRTIKDPIFLGVTRPPMEHRDENGLHLGETGYAPDFNDIVFIVVPDDTSYSYLFADFRSDISTDMGFTLAAEDLGGSYDWDFNDAVVNVTYVTKSMADVMERVYENVYSKEFNEAAGSGPSPDDSDSHISTYFYEITVTPMAAGGTMPIYLAYNGKILKSIDDMISQFDGKTTYNDIAAAFSDWEAEWEDGTYIVGEELHNWLGESDTKKVVNVTSAKADHQAAYKVVFYAHDNPRDYYNTDRSTAGAQHLRRFSVIVDKNKTLDIPGPTKLIGSANTSSTVNKYVHEAGLHPFTPNGQIYEIGGVSEDITQTAPQMICIGYGAWAREMVNIKDAFNQGNDDPDKSLVEKWLEGGSTPWHEYFDELVTKNNLN